MELGSLDTKWTPENSSGVGIEDRSLILCAETFLFFGRGVDTKTDTTGTLRGGRRIFFCPRRERFDATRALQVVQLVAQAAQRIAVARLAPTAEILPDEVEHGCERAEVVVCLKVKIDVLPHGGSVPCGRQNNSEEKLKSF